VSNQDAGATPPSNDYSAAVAQPPASLDTLLDMSLPVSIEFGRTSLTVQDVLALSTGSVIQLERMVGEPIDVFVSDRKLAEGEVVVIGEHFGVRITRIIADQEGNEA
jgi:flagellar motor switch protein FliN/FliY